MNLVASNLLRATIYPDSVDGGDQVKYNYNRQGQTTTLTDQNGTVRSSDYDLIGRKTQDRVTTVGSGVDNAVLRIATTYEVRGMVLAVTSYDNATVGAGSVLNEVKQTYNDFAQLVTEQQEHVGAVGGSTYKVQYTYAEGVGNTSRPLTVSYPNGRVLTFGYGPFGGQLNQIDTLEFDGDDVASYEYLGLGTIVSEDYGSADMRLVYTNGAHTYPGFDRFGRIVDQKWIETDGETDIDRFLYGYDRVSNRTYRENTVVTAIDLDELYGYDDLQRLTAANRGELVAAKDRITDHALAQTWNLDPTGNWKGFSNFDQATPANDLVQQRTTNAANEITDLTETVGDQWTTPAHDRSGNMTTMPQPDTPTSAYTCSYDAWNRLATVKDGATTIGQYSYDGLNRRIRKYVPGGGDSYQHLYYNVAWQLLETRESPTFLVPATAQYQYVWSLRYLDAPVLRDDLVPTPDVRLYYTGDANFNVTALFEFIEDLTAVERYVYDPYGQVTIYNGTWSATRASSSYDNSTLYTGQWRDTETGLMYYRRRYYHALLGRFISPDPIGYDGGMNVFEYVGSSALQSIDPFGLLTVVNRATVFTVGGTVKKWLGGADLKRPAGSLGTTVPRSQISLSCCCDTGFFAPLFKRWHLCSWGVTITFWSEVYLNAAYATPAKKAWLLRAENDHVLDFTRWAGGAGKNAATRAETNLLKKSYWSKSGCGTDVRDTMRAAMRASVRVAVTATIKLHDKTGRHKWRGRNQRR